MTDKALLTFAAIVVAVLFPFMAFAQEQEKAQTADEKESQKIVTISDLQAQKKIIDEYKVSYTKAKAEYDAECTGQSYKSIEDFQKNFQKKCSDKQDGVTAAYNQYKKEIDSYNKNVERYKVQTKTK